MAEIVKEGKGRETVVGRGLVFVAAEVHDQ